MKRYEYMEKEEILDFFKDCLITDCSDCPAYKYCDKPDQDCLIDYLTEDISLVHRWQMVKSQEDMEGLFGDFNALCKGGQCWDKETNLTCKYFNVKGGTAACYHAYISDLVENKALDGGNDNA